MNPRNRFLQTQEEDFPACPGCKQGVYPKDRPVLALGAKWHPGCLKCSQCGSVLNVRSLESFEKKPYCHAHLPRAQATTVDNDFHVKDALNKPKAAARQKGVDVSSQNNFRSGNLAKGGADTGTFGTGIQTADSGTYESNAQASTADTGTFGTGFQKADQGEFLREGGAQWASTGTFHAGISKADSGTFESQAGSSTADTGTYGTGFQSSDSGTFENNPHQYSDSQYAQPQEVRQAQAPRAGGGAPPPSRANNPPPSSTANKGPAPARPPTASKNTAPPPPVHHEEPAYHEEPAHHDDGGYGGGHDDYQQEEPAHYEEPAHHDDGGYGGGHDDGGHSSGGRTCTALFDYGGDNDGDLAFSAGATITILDDTDPSGWWQGELNGTSGFFPSNFVQAN